MSSPSVDHCAASGLAAGARASQDSPRSRFWVGTIGFAWGAVVAGGFSLAALYEHTPAAPHATVTAWPAASGLTLSADKPTLVMFIHPECPCTRASLAEASELRRDCGSSLEMRFVFLEKLVGRWIASDSEHWETIGDLRLGSRHVDREGVEHLRFGATTSGETFVFSPSGALIFHGGITGSRGHQGDNAGRRAIAAVVGKSFSATSRTPVYGCSLDAICDSTCLLPRTEHSTKQ